MSFGRSNDQAKLSIESLTSRQYHNGGFCPKQPPGISYDPAGDSRHQRERANSMFIVSSDILRVPKGVWSLCFSPAKYFPGLVLF
ncbi:hypothetical protein FO519_005771 [Halicephalobus sp. NKZ332]|nr:hypothetical protein FO519_005771 [Halicephalobus sp. NKZ332]